MTVTLSQRLATSEKIWYNDFIEDEINDINL